MKSVRRFGALVLAALGAAGCDGGESAVADARMRVSDVLGGADTAGYARALEPRPFTFPRDHGPHPAFRTEWWYLTGNLAGEEGRRFGYQLTIFRVALAPPSGGSGASRRGDGPAVEGAGSGGGGSVGPRSAWATRQAYMGHFAVTDADGERFLAEERFARGALGLAGAGLDPLRVWIEDWTIEGRAGDGFAARARGDGFAVELELERGKAPVLNGERGLSPKGPEPGNASYYYSLTRMPTRGTVTVDGRTIVVRGLSWLDREWSTSALSEGVVGWDWFALQLDDGTDIMLYRLRKKDGSTDRWSAGTVVAPDGQATRMDHNDFELEVLDRWQSPRGGTYPGRWRLDAAPLDRTLTVTPILAEQELDLTVRYWEGAVDVTSEGAAIGRGYVELSGYAESSGR